MNCPGCQGKDTLRIPRTVHYKSFVIRLRECSACGYSFTTREERFDFAKDYDKEQFLNEKIRQAEGDVPGLFDEEEE